MSNSIWKNQKPDVFKPHRILVIYEAHDEPELMFSSQYDTLTNHRYVNRWCYWDEFIAQADKAERLQKAVDLALNVMGGLKSALTHAGHTGVAEALAADINEIELLIKENQ